MHATFIAILLLLGQDSPATPTSPEGKLRAQTLLKEGAALYEKGDMVPALEKFEAAYAAFPSPKLLFNIGQTTRSLGRLTEALDAFQRFLSEESAAPSDMRTMALTAVSELQTKLARLRILCTAEGAEITVDGKVVGNTPLSGETWVMPGSHQVTARHPEYPPALVQVDVAPEAVHEVRLDVQSVPLPAQRAQVPKASRGRMASPLADAQGSREEASGSVQGDLSESTGQAAGGRQGGWLGGRKWTWVAAGSAVALAGGATYFGLSMQSKYDSLNRTCGPASASADGSYVGCSDSDIGQAILRRNVANVLWGLSGAAAITAGVLYFTEGRAVQVAPLAGDRFGVVARMAY
jgi:hypothetical protein